jgi:hypothetical protein
MNVGPVVIDPQLFRLDVARRGALIEKTAHLPLRRGCTRCL